MRPHSWGQNFFTSGGQVLFGSVAPIQESSLLLHNDTHIAFTLPQAEGTANVKVVISGQESTNSLPFIYDPPRIDSVEPSIGPTGCMSHCVVLFLWSRFFLIFPCNHSIATDGLHEDNTEFLLTINGANFGSNGGVTIGSSFCLNAGLYQDDKIICLLPPVRSQRVQTSHLPQQLTFLFFLFLVLAAYMSLYVLLSPLPPPYAQGEGTDLPLFVTGLDGRKSNTVNFSYAPPNITSFSPLVGPTKGGISMEVLGFNFGSSGTRGLTVSFCHCVRSADV